MELKGRTILITGVSTGIGLELAKQLHLKGNTVVGCARRADRLQEAKSLLPELHTIVCDVSTNEERRRLFAEVTTQFPDLDVVVLNAGIQKPVNFLNGEEGLQLATDEIAINLNAPVHMAMLFIPFLKEKAESALVTVSSGLAFAPRFVTPVYCATKAAIHNLSLTLRYQLRETGIKVFEMIPPMVVSELAGREVMEQRGGMPTEACVESMVSAMERNEFEHAIGMAEFLRNPANFDQAFGMFNPA